MIKKANINWSAKQLVKMMEKGTITFDNAIQRGLTWDNNRKSLLIHSLLEGYPVPPFYAAKDEKGYSCLDGKQRSNAISEYMNDIYALANVPDVTTEEGEEIEVNGMKFSELEEELQDRIKDYSLTFYYFDGITDDEISSLFFRLNNGKALSAIELSRVKAKCLDKIREIGNHDLFHNALTEKAMNKYTNEDLVIKSWVLLNVENPSFETKTIRPIMETIDITDEQAEQLNKIFDRILQTHCIIASQKTEDEKVNKINKKIAKRVITRTHLLSLVPVAMESIDNNISAEVFTEFTKEFFSGSKSASISDIYNSASGAGSAKQESVRKRITAITEAYRGYIKKHNIKPVEPTPEPETNEQEASQVDEEVAITTENTKTSKKSKVIPFKDDFETLPRLDDEWQESFSLSGSLADIYKNTVF